MLILILTVVIWSSLLIQYREKEILKHCRKIWLSQHGTDTSGMSFSTFRQKENKYTPVKTSSILSFLFGVYIYVQPKRERVFCVLERQIFSNMKCYRMEKG